MAAFVAAVQLETDNMTGLRLLDMYHLLIPFLQGGGRLHQEAEQNT